MRFIRKTAEPRALLEFKRESAGAPQNLRFAFLTRVARREIHESLLTEQGRLCAYTMVRIGRGPSEAAFNDFHIEHVRPQSRNAERELEYGNIVLCTPGPGSTRCPYGAHQKDDANITEENFVSPLSPTCETRFRYRATGEVVPSNPLDAAAAMTIDLLKLNHRQLWESRTEALKSQGLTLDAPKPISAARATRLAKIITEPDNSGQIAPFCIAIRQVAENFARRQKARSTRLAKKPFP